MSVPNFSFLACLEVALNILFCLSKYLHPSSSAEDLLTLPPSQTTLYWPYPQWSSKINQIIKNNQRLLIFLIFYFFHGQTDRQTDRQTDIWTYRSSLPELKKPLNILFCVSKYLHPSSSAEDLSMLVVFALFETLRHLNKQEIKLLPCDSTPYYLCKFFIDLHWGRICGQLLD